MVSWEFRAVRHIWTLLALSVNEEKMAHCSRSHPKTALQQLQFHSRDQEAREVWLCLCLVSCYKNEHVMGERGREAELCRRRGVREGGLEPTALISLPEEKPHQGHWSHTENTSLRGEEFHRLTDTKSQLCSGWVDYTDSGLTEGKVWVCLSFFCHSYSALHAAVEVYSRSVNFLLCLLKII